VTLKIPRHLAIIMDGNGRWAEARGLPRTKGHQEGAERVKEIVTACREFGVEVLTLYSFSTENWRRPETEIRTLMDILRRYVLSERSLMMENGIRLNAIGDIERLPLFARLPLKALMKDTRGNQDMILNLALSYGSRAEMLQAVRALAVEVKKGNIDPNDIDEDLFSRNLFTAGMPDPDLLIRTSGELRLSNFLLWQAAYSELYIQDSPWPEFRKSSLEEAFRVYTNRERRFGKTGKQIRGEAS
jgi:undecaprenyl diphosphate synthase